MPTALSKTQLKSFVKKAKEIIPSLKVLAVGGRLERDLDALLVAEKLDKISDLREWAEQEFNRKVSISPMTPLMWDEYFWSAKVATMVYKGPIWLYGSGKMIDEERLQSIIRSEAQEFVNRILKILGKGFSKEKAIELLVQEIVLLVM